MFYICFAWELWCAIWGMGCWVSLYVANKKKSLCVFVSLDPSEAQKLNKPVWDVVAEQMHIYIFIYIEMPTNSIVQYQM